MIIELTPTANKKHMLVRLVNDKVVAKKTPKKRPSEKVVEEVVESAKVGPSSKSDEVFDIDFLAPLSRKVKRISSRILEFRECQQCLL